MNKIVKSLTGKVVSSKGAKTVVVAVTRIVRHPLYKKQIRRTRRFAAHYEESDILVGDMVRIVPTRPMSKTKHYIVEGKI